MNYIPETASDCIAEAEMSLRKGILILGDLTEKYPFYRNNDKHVRDWSLNYKRTTMLIDIAFDYMADVSMNISKAKECNGIISADINEIGDRIMGGVSE